MGIIRLFPQISWDSMPTPLLPPLKAKRVFQISMDTHAIKGDCRVIHQGKSDSRGNVFVNNDVTNSITKVLSRDRLQNSFLVLSEFNSSANNN